MALPTFVSAGVEASGSGNITPPLPAGFLANDILLMFIETANQAVAVPTGWAHVTGSPQGVGTVGGSSSTMLTVLWKRAIAAETAPTINDPGDHVLAFIAAFRGCIATGNPWSITSTATDAVLNASFTIPGATTTRPDCLVVLACTLHLDGTAPRVNSWTNTSLTNILIQADRSTVAGNDGALGMATGELATPVTYGSTAVALSASQIKAGMTIALRPSSLSLVASPGGYSDTGTGSLVFGTHRLTATPGVEALFGTSAGPRAGRLAVASPGVFQSVGMASTPRADRSLSAQPGSQLQVGTSGATRADHKLPAFGGVYAQAGTATALRRDPRLMATSGVHALTGTEAVLALMRRLIAVPGGHFSTGAPSSILHRAMFSAAVGSHFLSGKDVDLIVEVAPRVEIIRGARAQLYSAIALGDFTVTSPPGSPTTNPPSAGLIIPITRSWPEADIGISRVICRIHLLGSQLVGMYATSLFLARVSDSSLLGGCATDFRDILARRAVQIDDVLADREFLHAPDYFKLAKTDSLIANFRTFDDERIGNFRTLPSHEVAFIAKLDVLFSYVLLDAKGNPI